MEYRSGKEGPLLSRREGILFVFLVVLVHLVHRFKEVIFGSKAFFMHLGTSKGPEVWVGSEREVRKHTAAEAPRVVSGLWGRTRSGQAVVLGPHTHLPFQNPPPPQPGAGICSSAPENSSSRAGYTAAWLRHLLPRAHPCDLTESYQPPGRPWSSCRQGNPDSEGPGSFLRPHSWGVVGLGPEPSSPVAWALPWPRVGNPRLSVSCRFAVIGG